MESTVEKIVTAIKNMLNCSLIEDNGNYIFEISLNENDKRVISVPRTRFDTVVTNLKNLSEKNQTVLYNNHFYEILVSEENRYRPGILFRDEKIIKDDPENQLTYKLSFASEEYLSHILVKIAETEALRVYPFSKIRVRRYFERCEGEFDIYDLLRGIFSHYITLNIQSNRSKSFDDFSKYSNSFLFQLSYNLNTPLIELRYIDDVIGSSRLFYGRRARVEEVEAPKRVYLEDLTYHYQMAIATESPLLAYISYYHIAEHFFDKVYTDDLIKGIQEKITLPDFSTKRRKDILELIKYINKRLRIRGEENIINEQEALKLTLKLFLSIDELINKLNTYDPTLLDYYKTTSVKFSGGDVVDLTEPDSEQIYDKLSKRIYKTRNAIVHSKENEKSRYVPFEDDRVLIKEIPLLRFIGEDIILKNSGSIS